MKKIQYGFTLIELMITMTVIGILSAIALPTYQNYAKRAHVTEGLSLARGAQAAVVEYYSANDVWPANNAQAALGTDTQIDGHAVIKVRVARGGKIIILYDRGVVYHQTLVLLPMDIDGSITWECGGGSLSRQYRPARCRS